MRELLQSDRHPRAFWWRDGLRGSMSGGRERILGLIGPDGSGKTTPVNCISASAEDRPGSVRLRDRTITRSSRTRRAKSGLGRTFQSPRLFTELSVRENVETGLTRFAAAGWTVELVERVLEWLSFPIESPRYAASSSVRVFSAGSKSRERLSVSRMSCYSTSLRLDSTTRRPPICASSSSISEEVACDPRHRSRHQPHHERQRPRQGLDEGDVIFIGGARGRLQQQLVVEAYLGAD